MHRLDTAATARKQAELLVHGVAVEAGDVVTRPLLDERIIEMLRHHSRVPEHALAAVCCDAEVLYEFAVSVTSRSPLLFADDHNLVFADAQTLKHVTMNPYVTERTVWHIIDSGERDGYEIPEAYERCVVFEHPGADTELCRRAAAGLVAEALWRPVITAVCAERAVELASVCPDQELNRFLFNRGDVAEHPGVLAAALRSGVVYARAAEVHNGDKPVGQALERHLNTPCVADAFAKLFCEDVSPTGVFCQAELGRWFSDWVTWGNPEYITTTNGAAVLRCVYRFLADVGGDTCTNAMARLGAACDRYRAVADECAVALWPATVANVEHLLRRHSIDHDIVWTYLYTNGTNLELTAGEYASLLEAMLSAAPTR